MNGTENELFFQASKKIKRERIKWISIIIMSNLLNIIFWMPSEVEERAPVAPWPTDWVEISLEVKMIASGSLPLKVTVFNDFGQTVFTEAFVTSRSKEDQGFKDTQRVYLKVAPSELSKINQQQNLKVLPYSQRSQNLKPLVSKKVNYEIHF